MSLNTQDKTERNVRNPFSSFFLTGLLAFCLFCHAFPVDADTAGDIRKIRERLDQMQSKLRIFLDSYNSIKVQGSRTSLQKRLADGQLNFFLKDYVRASIILFDAVENKQNEGKYAWYEAIYYLAESLYYNRNYYNAAANYQKLVEGKRQYADKALVRLMEIAEKTNRYKWLNSHFQNNNLPSGKLRNRIQYLRAKGLYRQKKFDDARQIFRRIPQGEQWPKAQYFLAVIRLQTEAHSKSIPAAINQLQAAANTIGKKASQQELKSVILVSLGRLSLEQGNLEAALKFYRQIDRRAKVYDQALYEVCWTYIKRAQRSKKPLKIKQNYKSALRTLELLLAFLPDSPFYPRAQLLRSHLLLQLSQFDNAMKNYQKIVKRYSNVHKEMNLLLKNWGNPVQTFETLISQNLDKFSVASVLPKDAIRWMSNEELMKRTLVMLRDLRSMNTYLSESRLIIQKLDQALKAENQIALSPTLKDGRLRALSMRSELIQHQEKLNQIQRDLVFPKATPSQRQQYASIQARLKATQTLFQKTPKNRKELEARNKTVQRRIDNMKARLHKLQLQFDYTTNFIRSARNWLTGNSDAQKLSPAQRKSISQEVTKVQQQNNKLKKDKEALERTLDLAMIQLGNISVDPEEERIQQRYRQLLDEERRLLGQVRGELSSTQQGYLDDIRTQTSRIRTSRKQLRDFFKLLSRLVKQYSRVMRSRVQSEKNKLNQHEQQVYALSNRSKRLASRIAYNTFLAVRGKFRDLVLRADVGVIDVVWQEKQTTQAQIKKLSKERNSELRVLDSEFRDILEEVK